MSGSRKSTITPRSASAVDERAGAGVDDGDVAAPPGRVAWCGRDEPVLVAELEPKPVSVARLGGDRRDARLGRRARCRSRPP